MRKRSPGRPSTVNVSTSTLGSVPSARVIGALRVPFASSGVRTPLSTRLGDERVVRRELLEGAVPQEIRASRRRGRSRRFRSRVDERRRHRRTHAGGRGIGRRPLPDAPVGLDDQSRDPLLPSRLRSCFLEGGAARRAATSPARAPPMPSATAKSGGSQMKASSLRRRLRPVSVTPCARPILIATWSSVSPMRTTSPARRSRAPFRRAPLTNVPFVEPRSSTQTPSGRGSMRACRAEANSSRVEPDPASASRPATIRGASPRSCFPAQLEARQHDEAAGRTPSSARSAEASAAPRTMLSCGAPPMSFVAVRTTSRMNHRGGRGRRSSGSGGSRRFRARRRSRSWKGSVEDDLRRAERDPVAVPEPLPIDALAVHDRAVQRAEVDDPVRVLLVADLRVLARC